MTRARREQLILDHMDLVRSIAHKLARTYWPLVSLEDFLQDGMVGLCEAAWRCKSVATFRNFAHFRIHGAIMDGYRRRSYRERMHVSLEAQAAESPIAAEIQSRRDASALPDELAIRQQIRAYVQRAIAELPGEEQHVMREHLHGVPIEEIAEDAGTTRRQASNRLSRAKFKVTERLKKTA